MGYLKNLMIEQSEKGYQFMEDKYVCHHCFEDYAVKAFIKDNAVRNRCDYCGRRSRKTIAASMTDVLDFISEGVNVEWDDPVNCVGWMSSEGGWIGAEVYDSYDMIYDDFWELGIQEESLKADLLDAFSQRQWCKRDPYNLLPHEELIFDWEQFSNQVKHNTRYMFFRMRRRASTDTYEEHRELYEILFSLGDITCNFGLIETVPVNTAFVRARAHNRRENFSGVQDIGPPPENKTVSSRMSPQGIVMFYGAMDEQTAISEVHEKTKGKVYITSAVFRNSKPFKILNLANLSPVPSLFDSSQRENRAPLIFLHSFCRDLSKPIKHRFSQTFKRHLIVNLKPLWNITKS
jgi:hypothetical protein